LVSWAGIRAKEASKAMGQSRWSVEQRLEIVLTVLRGREPMTQPCGRDGVSETAVYGWREQFLEVR
jgi:transposase-like protein